MACLLMPARSAITPGRSPSGPGIAEDRDVGQVESLEARRIELTDDTPMNGLSRSAQQRADQQLPRLDKSRRHIFFIKIH